MGLFDKGEFDATAEDVKEEEQTTVKIKTGKFVELNTMYGSYEGSVLDEKPEITSYCSLYVDHKVEIPVAQAVQLIIDHLGLQVEYEQAEPAKEEVIGGLYKPKKRKKK